MQQMLRLHEGTLRCLKMSWLPGLLTAGLVDPDEAAN